MAVSSSSKGVSFSDLTSRDEVMSWDEDDNRRPRRNPFDDVGSDFEFVESDSSWISAKEVSDFMKTSLGLSLSDDKEESLGAAWGGLEYSLVSEKPKSDTSHASVQSASARSQSAASTTNQRQSSFSAGTKAQTQPTRQPSTSSTRTRYSSSIPSPSSVSRVSAAAVRKQTQITPQNSVPTVQTAVQNVSTSIQDVLADTPQVSVTEYNRLQTETGRLRQELQAARREKTSVPPVEETVKKILHRQHYFLEGHKSLKDKVSLLQHAIKVHDGNVITEVVLFLKKTLTQRIFRNEIKRHPEAVHHLCKYLKEHYEYDELTEFYRSLGRFEDAAMLQFEQAIKTKDPNGRLTKLKYILRQYFEGYQQLTEETAFLKEYIDLLDNQLIIESTDSKAQLEGKNHVMVVHPRQASLPLCSVIVTLYYCCRYHFEEPEWIIDLPDFLTNIFSSPLAIRSKFKLSEKQYEWTAVSARANLKRWPDIEKILTSKSWFGSTKMKSVIGFKQVVDILHQHRAPEKVLWTYLKLIDDRQERLSLATKLQCHEAVIETLVAMKDRQQLEEYRKKLKRTAPEQAKITDYLNNSQIKWRN